MSLLLVLLSVVCLSSALVYKPTTPSVGFAAFEEYNRFWNKTHATLLEKHQRYQIFVQASTKIAELNAKSSDARFGFTKFADWTYEEFKVLNGFIPSKPLAEHQPSNVAAPSGSIDWVARGKTTPVKNQGQCGSCWAFSATETVESANLIAGRSVSSLSPQEIVDCDSNDNGCSGGDPQEALQWVQQQGGLDTESCYPYTAQDGQCASGQCTPSLTVNNVIPVSSSESAMYSALQSGPLSICCDASQWQYYDGGVLTADQCGTSIDHAIQLTGYSSNQGGYWIVRNSWGADWGESGFIYLQYGQNTCGITSETTGATA
jgi:C1A family cysteine protease